MTPPPRTGEKKICSMQMQPLLDCDSFARGAFEVLLRSSARSAAGPVVPVSLIAGFGRHGGDLRSQESSADASKISSAFRSFLSSYGAQHWSSRQFDVLMEDEAEVYRFRAPISSCFFSNLTGFVPSICGTLGRCLSSHAGSQLAESTQDGAGGGAGAGAAEQHFPTRASHPSGTPKVSR